MVAFLLQADELDGEIDLRSCTDVTEYAVQRNYGFQIHVGCVRQGGHDGGPGGRAGIERDFLSETGFCHSLPRGPVFGASQKLCCQHSVSGESLVSSAGVVQMLGRPGSQCGSSKSRLVEWRNCTLCSTPGSRP